MTDSNRLRAYSPSEAVKIPVIETGSGNQTVSIRPVVLSAAGAANIVPTTYDAPGSAGGPDLYIKPEAFRETFCADLAVDIADVMTATQRPVSLGAFTENATAVGWKTKPSWYLVSEHDHAIPPDCERFMAKRMGATTESIAASHCAFIAQPVVVAKFIAAAAQAA